MQQFIRTCRRWRGALRWSIVLLLGIAGAVVQAAADPAVPPENALLAWPPLTRQAKPWAYNWWMGSAVDKENLTRELQRYHDGGLGGIHVIPIYGAKGAESRYLDYLSPQWLEMFHFTVAQAATLDMGVDLTTGTGWCFGGPQVTTEDAGQFVSLTVANAPAAPGDWSLVPPKERFSGQILRVVACDPQGHSVALPTTTVDAHGKVHWNPPAAGWKLIVLLGHPGIKVKRAAPGGQGPMLNPVYPAAMQHYLQPFATAFPPDLAGNPRAMYHDSYEYSGGHGGAAEWAPDFLQRFAQRRGYALESQLPALAGIGPADTVSRVRTDYHQSVAEIMVEDVFTQWTTWCRQRGIQTRLQAHGAPANLLDFYAIADTPETEVFNKAGVTMANKIASSAAHVAGRPLTSSETGTWMDEHFHETLAAMKQLVDGLMVSGINHIFYHGCCYSPDDAAWPGWLFYAATEMNPRNAIWHDVPVLNAYIGRCQSVLQAGQPDNDVLVYWPIFDYWNQSAVLSARTSMDNPAWFNTQPAGLTGKHLWSHGVGLDYISDRQLAATAMANGLLQTPGAAYRAIIVPPTRLMPLETLWQLHNLATRGGVVIFDTQLPVDVPGLNQLDQRRAAFKELLAAWVLTSAGPNLQHATVGQGQVFVGDVDLALTAARIAPEGLTLHPDTVFLRRRYEGGRHYFIVNQAATPLDAWVPLATPAVAVEIMDPMTGKTGLAQTQAGPDGKLSVYLYLEPQQSIILRTFAHGVPPSEHFSFYKPGGAFTPLGGPWDLKFVDGGPALPKPRQLTTLGSWTATDDPEAQRFAGTALYQTTVAAPAGPGPWVLDLGTVCHSARVRLNGRDLGAALLPPYRVGIPANAFKPTDNTLEIAVTNLSANRLRDLDLRHVPWRIFNDINFVSRSYEPFNAALWPVEPSGLLGPVRVAPVDNAVPRN